MARRLILALLVVGAAWSGVAAAQPTAASVVKSVDAAYAKITTAKLAFTQTVTSTTFGSTATTSGAMWAVRPGQLRWEYFAKGSRVRTKIFVLNGGVLTFVNIRNRQVIQGPVCANATPPALSFLTGQGSIAAASTATLRAVTSSTIELELTPNQPTAQFSKLVLTVDPSTYLVQRSVVTDAAGNTNQFDFTNVTTGMRIQPTVFKVGLSKLKNGGYQIIKQTAQCSGSSGSGSGSGSATGTGTGTGSGAGTSTGSGSVSPHNE